MKKIFLHIGTFKTGSTALQFHMHKNRDRLLENGFYYGDYFHNYWVHSNLCYGLLREALIEYGVFDNYKNHPRFLNVAEDPEKIISRIKVNSADTPNIIISSEAFFADSYRTLIGLRTQLSDQHKSEINNYMRKRLQGLLSEISDNVTIVCYLRRQDLFIESQYNQYCKNPWYGDPRAPLPSFNEFVSCKPIELNYFSVLEEWAKIFNDAEFIIVPYEKESFQHDMETDFYIKILKLNVQEVEKLESIERNQTNLRLDRDVLEYKFQLGVKNSAAAQLLRKYSEQMQTVKDYAYFTLEERKQFMESFIYQNEKVAKKYLHQIDGKLFQNMRYDIPTYGGLRTDKIMEITRYLVDEMDK